MRGNTCTARPVRSARAPAVVTSDAAYVSVYNPSPPDVTPDVPAPSYHFNTWFRV